MRGKKSFFYAILLLLLVSCQQKTDFIDDPIPEAADPKTAPSAPDVTVDGRTLTITSTYTPESGETVEYYISGKSDLAGQLLPEKTADELVESAGTYTFTPENTGYATDSSVTVRRMYVYSRTVSSSETSVLSAPVEVIFFPEAPCLFASTDSEDGLISFNIYEPLHSAGLSSITFSSCADDTGYGSYTNGPAILAESDIDFDLKLYYGTTSGFTPNDTDMLTGTIQTGYQIEHTGLSSLSTGLTTYYYKAILESTDGKSKSVVSSEVYIQPQLSTMVANQTVTGAVLDSEGQIFETTAGDLLYVDDQYWIVQDSSGNATYESAGGVPIAADVNGNNIAYVVYTYTTNDNGTATDDSDDYSEVSGYLVYYGTISPWSVSVATSGTLSATDSVLSVAADAYQSYVLIDDNSVNAPVLSVVGTAQTINNVSAVATGTDSSSNDYVVYVDASGVQKDVVTAAGTLSAASISASYVNAGTKSAGDGVHHLVAKEDVLLFYAYTSADGDGETPGYISSANYDSCTDCHNIYDLIEMDLAGSDSVVVTDIAFDTVTASDIDDENQYLDIDSTGTRYLFRSRQKFYEYNSGTTATTYLANGDSARYSSGDDVLLQVNSDKNVYRLPSGYSQTMPTAPTTSYTVSNPSNGDGTAQSKCSADTGADFWKVYLNDGTGEQLYAYSYDICSANFVFETGNIENKNGTQSVRVKAVNLSGSGSKSGTVQPRLSNVTSVTASSALSSSPDLNPLDFSIDVVTANPYARTLDILLEYTVDGGTNWTTVEDRTGIAVTGADTQTFTLNTFDLDDQTISFRATVTEASGLFTDSKSLTSASTTAYSAISTAGPTNPPAATGTYAEQYNSVFLGGRLYTLLSDSTDALTYVIGSDTTQYNVTGGGCNGLIDTTAGESYWSNIATDGTNLYITRQTWGFTDRAQLYIVSNATTSPTCTQEFSEDDYEISGVAVYDSDSDGVADYSYTVAFDTTGANDYAIYQRNIATNTWVTLFQQNTGATNDGYQKVTDMTVLEDGGGNAYLFWAYDKSNAAGAEIVYSPDTLPVAAGITPMAVFNGAGTIETFTRVSNAGTDYIYFIVNDSGTYNAYYIEATSPTIVNSITTLPVTKAAIEWGAAVDTPYFYWMESDYLRCYYDTTGAGVWDYDTTQGLFADNSTNALTAGDVNTPLNYNFDTSTMGAVALYDDAVLTGGSFSCP